MESETSLTTVGTFVWAKLSGHPYWPGQVVNPEGTGLKQRGGTVVVKFFASNDYAQVKPDQLKEYKPGVTQGSGKKQRKMLSKAVRHIERAIKGEKIESDTEEPVEKKRKKDSDVKDSPKVSTPPRKVLNQKVQKPTTPKSKPPKTLKRQSSNVSSTSNANSAASNEESDQNSEAMLSSEPEGKVTPDERRPVKKRSLKTAITSRTNGESGSTFNRVRPSVMTEVKPADSSTSLAPLIDGLPATEDKIGFLGCGIMGTPMAMNLIRTGHDVSVWNRTIDKTKPLKEAGATVYETKRQVVENCDIIFACVSDPKAARDIVFGPDGILKYINEKKSYVDMSTVDAATTIKIGNAIKEKGGRFLEAPVSGSKKPAEAGELIIMCAGERSLYVDCYTCFEAMSKKWFFMGDLGSGAKMKLVVNAIMGAQMCALSEGMALAEKCDLDQVTLLEILSLGALCSPLVTGKGSAILESNFPPHFPLKHQQKDLRLALDLSESVSQSMPCISASNELYKRAMSASMGDRDMASVYRVVNEPTHNLDM